MSPECPLATDSTSSSVESSTNPTLVQELQDTSDSNDHDSFLREPQARTQPPPSLTPHTLMQPSYIFCSESVYFNARSLLPKLDELRALCLTYQPHVICVVESWLDESIQEEEI